MELALSEQRHHCLPLALGNVAMDALGIHAAHLQELGQPLRGAFGVAKAHDPLQLFPGYDAGNGVHFLICRNFYAVLEDIGLILLGGLHGDLLGIPLIDPGNVHHLSGNGS